jgi:hypothetical protein
MEFVAQVLLITVLKGFCYRSSRSEVVKRAREHHRQKLEISDIFNSNIFYWQRTCRKRFGVTRNTSHKMFEMRS